MLTILGPRDRRTSHCDGLARRDFLKIGGMVMGGLTLPQLLAAEAHAGIGQSHKAIINVFLPGGPPVSLPVLHKSSVPGPSAWATPTSARASKSEKK